VGSSQPRVAWAFWASRLELCIHCIYHRRRFEFDPQKATANLKKHGVSLADAEGVFHDALAIHVEDPDAQREQRFVGVGMGTTGTVLVVVYAYSGDAVRVISARRASRKECKDYETRLRFL